MDDRRLFVQFIHPGGEHQPDRDNGKAWNVGGHKRKFLISHGRFLDRGELREDNLLFWGEWEPQSRVVRRFEERARDWPQFLYQPYYGGPDGVQSICRQNTDPFVFGEQFHYTGCLQHTKRGPTQLHNLDRGSIILFGSCRDKSKFVIDTVFVVDRWLDHSQANQLTPEIRDAVSATYGEVTLDPWYARNVPRDQTHRLYFGATFEDKVDGMFSFFPCQTEKDAGSGFPRPIIRIDHWITQTLLQGKKMTALSDGEAAQRVWAEVIGQVEDQGLKLGVSADLPRRSAV